MTQDLDSMIWNPHIIAMHYTADFLLFIDFVNSNLASDINARMILEYNNAAISLYLVKFG